MHEHFCDVFAYNAYYSESSDMTVVSNVTEGAHTELVTVDLLSLDTRYAHWCRFTANAARPKAVVHAYAH